MGFASYFEDIRDRNPSFGRGTIGKRNGNVPSARPIKVSGNLEFRKQIAEQLQFIHESNQTIKSAYRTIRRSNQSITDARKTIRESSQAISNGYRIIQESNIIPIRSDVTTFCPTGCDGFPLSRE